MLQRVIAFHRDVRADWVAGLACGHTQHIRHDPPFQLRPWVVTEAGRQAHLGIELACKKCDENAPLDKPASRQS